VRFWRDPTSFQGRLCAALESSVREGGVHTIYLYWLFQKLPLATTVEDYHALLPWKMPADLR
jgi:hypothetical protein